MRCNQNIPRSFSTRSSSQQCLASFTPVLKHFPLCDIRLVCRVKRQYWLLFETILNDHGSCFSGYDLQHFLLACTLISSLRADGLCRTVACVILFHYRAHWKYWSFFLKDYCVHTLEEIIFLFLKGDGPDLNAVTLLHVWFHNFCHYSGSRRTTDKRILI